MCEFVLIDFTFHIHVHLVCFIKHIYFTGHCVIYGVESWSGVLEWSHGVESWSGFWSGMKSDFVIVALLRQDLVLIDQFLVNT